VATLTASAGGSAAVTYPLSSLLGRAGISPADGASAPGGARLVILNSGAGTPAIGTTGPIDHFGRFPVYGVEPGMGQFQPGWATLSYDPNAQTLSVTVNATGLTPGAHAAHIHVGSCQQQGGVAYMLMDFTATSGGVIDNQTRTVSGISGVELSGGWYLNLHQGNSSNILDANGQPTINFRPLLCANIQS
jgi:hypothetical protein